MDGRTVLFTPKGLSVIPRQRSISLRRSSGVGWVSAVSIPKAPGVRHRRGEFGIADPLHAALDDRVLNAQHFRDLGFHAPLSWLPPLFRRYYRAPCAMIAPAFNNQQGAAGAAREDHFTSRTMRAGCVADQARRTNQARLSRYRLSKAASRTRTTCRASRPLPSAIWCRQLVPSATRIALRGALRTAGSRRSSAIFIDTS